MNAPSDLANALSPAALADAAPFPSLRFDNAFARLPGDFYTRVTPTPLAAPYLVGFSDAAAALVGLTSADAGRPQFAEAFAGNLLLPGSEPLAAVYSGHQFGVYVPRLGDGRAILLGSVTGTDGQPWELQLKGAGKTPYSRMGDGRAVLRSSIREFLGSEALHGLGIPTTRALTVIGADAPVMRETVETAAVVTRMAPSFVRFGSFEYFYWTGQHDALRALLDFVVLRHFPALCDAPNRAQALLQEVVHRTAELMADWQAVGFVHGVMNTDNMSILGLTIDYGPFGFIDGFDLAHVPNHSDEQGRYAYSMQPQIGHWNLYALGQALVPLIGEPDAVKATLDTYTAAFEDALVRRLHAKLGLATVQPDDAQFVEGLLQLLHANRTDWTLFWRTLSRLRVEAADAVAADEPIRDLIIDRPGFDAWALRYRARLRAEGRVDAARAAAMNAVNPKYVLRNYLAEQAIAQARGDHGPRDFSEVARLLEALRRPYDEQPEFEQYARLPPDWAADIALSCSS